jgi:hypothetical protein
LLWRITYFVSKLTPWGRINTYNRKLPIYLRNSPYLWNSKFAIGFTSVHQYSTSKSNECSSYPHRYLFTVCSLQRSSDSSSRVVHCGLQLYLSTNNALCNTDFYDITRRSHPCAYHVGIGRGASILL